MEGSTSRRLDELLYYRVFDLGSSETGRVFHRTFLALKESLYCWPARGMLTFGG